VLCRSGTGVHLPWKNVLNTHRIVVGPLMGATDFSRSGRVRTWKSEVAEEEYTTDFIISTLILHVTYTLVIIHGCLMEYTIIHLYTLLITFIRERSADTLSDQPDVWSRVSEWFHSRARVLAYCRRDGLT